ncbi:unnamed protein product [Euphydryas editha]|uniref:Uncharacterized protein n=1 Tax=Euphydryas editha TaxID=104508 RepID=A0AAU9UA05_EUPED|nr:unnamed protein product [Euphydryas editha]
MPLEIRSFKSSKFDHVFPYFQYDESLHGGGYMEGGAMYHEHRLAHPHIPPVHYPPPAAPAHALPGEPLVHKRDKDAIYG